MSRAQAAPTNRGSLCAKGQADLQGSYSPDRFVSPMKNGAPTSWDEAMTTLTRALKKARKRGQTIAWLGRHRTGATAEIRINEDVLGAVLAAAAELAKRIDAPPPSVDGLLAMRGVLETVEREETEAERKTLEAGVLATLDEALDSLATDRGAEGRRLDGIIAGQIDAIAELTAGAGQLTAVQPAALKARLRRQVAELLETADGMADGLAEAKRSGRPILLVSGAPACLGVPGVW